MPDQDEDFIDRALGRIGGWFLAGVRRLGERLQGWVYARARIDPDPGRPADHPYRPTLDRLLRWFVEEGERASTQVALNKLKAGWDGIAAGCGCSGLKLIKARTDEIGWTLELKLPVGLTVADVMKQLGRLEAAIGSILTGTRVKIAPDSARLVRDPDRAERCTLRLVLRDPLQRPAPWPGAVIRSVREPIPLGPSEDGEVVEVAILPEDGKGLNLVAAGMKGSGKSSLLQIIVGNLIHATDCVLWVADLKFGVEFRPLEPCLDRLVTEVEDTIALLEAALRVVAERGRRLRSRAWHATDQEPLLVIVIDEFQALGAVPAAKDAEGRPKRSPMELMFEIARLGRAVGVQLILATQRPSAEALGTGGTGLRSQMDAQIATRVARADEVNFVLGPGSTSEGWRPDRFRSDQAGYFLLRGLSGYDRPRPARCYRVSDPQIASMARGCGEHPRAVLDDVSAAAAGRVAVVAEAADQSELSREGRLLIALQKAPASGASIRQLAEDLGIPRTWIGERIRALVAGGQVVEAGRGYRAAPGASGESDT